jgi:hypothetical protein
MAHVPRALHRGAGARRASSGPRGGSCWRWRTGCAAGTWRRRAWSPPDYWKPVFYRLEAEGFECVLADAKQVRSLPGERTREKNRAEKLLESAAIKLSSVVTDLHGVTGRDIMDHLAALPQAMLARIDQIEFFNS